MWVWCWHTYAHTSAPLPWSVYNICGYVVDIHMPTPARPCPGPKTLKYISLFFFSDTMLCVCTYTCEYGVYIHMNTSIQPWSGLERLKFISSVVLLGRILCVSYISIWVWCSYAYKYMNHIHTKTSMPWTKDIINHVFFSSPQAAHCVCVHVYIWRYQYTHTLDQRR